MRTSGHRVLITGGGSGIGLALAGEFVRAGNRVVVAGRSRERLEAAAAGLPGLATRVADVSKPGDRARLVEELPDLSVLVNNAGVQRNGPFAELGPGEVESEIAINLTAPLMLCHAFLPILLVRDEAAIVNVTSILGTVPKESAPVYCATKAGLRLFTRALRWQVEGTAVRVFELVPPVVDTGMTAGRGRDKIQPETVAAAFWDGFRSDRTEIPVGKARVARKIHRLSPGLAEKILRKS